MINITAIGDINVDLIAPVKVLPKKGKQVLIDDIQIHGGGCATNFSYACSKLGMKAKLFGRVGDDIFGHYIIELLKRGGVDVSGVKIVERTGATIALVQDMERSFISYKGENAEFSLGDIDIGKIDGDLVHLPSFFILEKMQPHYPKLIECIKAKKSFDTGWDPRGWKKKKIEAVKRILPKVDFFFPNLEEAKKIMGIKGQLSRNGMEKLAIKYSALGIPIVAIKIGEKGCIATDGQRIVRLPAYKIRVVDTTGAGDVFNAGFISSYLNGEDLKRCAEFGSAAAAISVTGAGWSRYPTYSEVESFLNSHNL